MNAINGVTGAVQRNEQQLEFSNFKGPSELGTLPSSIPCLCGSFINHTPYLSSSGSLPEKDISCPQRDFVAPESETPHPSSPSASFLLLQEDLQDMNVRYHATATAQPPNRRL